MLDIAESHILIQEMEMVFLGHEFYIVPDSVKYGSNLCFNTRDRWK